MLGSKYGSTIILFMFVPGDVLNFDVAVKWAVLIGANKEEESSKPLKHVLILTHTRRNQILISSIIMIFEIIFWKK